MVNGQKFRGGPGGVGGCCPGLPGCRWEADGLCFTRAVLSHVNLTGGETAGGAEGCYTA